MRKILIIDDNPMALFLLSEGLGKRNYDITEVDNGNDVLEIIEQIEPDLVILDIVMPNTSGYDILTKLKGKMIPVIVVSSLSSEEAKKKAFDLGAHRFISKPLDIDTLIKAVNEKLAYVN